MAVVEHWYPYAVGANQIEGHGDQKKYFTSKSTLIFASADCNVKFNSLNNVSVLIAARTWYEFKSNIFMVYVDQTNAFGATDYVLLYFEGVMYDEGRRPE